MGRRTFPSPPLERVSLALRPDFLAAVRTECDAMHVSLSEAARQALRTWLWVRQNTRPDGETELVVRVKATGELRPVVVVS